MCWLLSYSVNRNTSCTGDNSEYEENWWCSCASWWCKQSFLNVPICRKKVEVKTLAKTDEVREDRSLMIRPDINLEDVISVHEVSCIPRSFFASNGSMLPHMDKSKLFHILRAFYKEQYKNAQDQDDGSVLIIHAFPRASRNESFKTCLELSADFMASMTKTISRYITAHLVFDQYNTTTSLKQTTRERHKSSTDRTSYTCKYSTPIRMYLKVFPSESKNKKYTFFKKHSIIT